MVVSMSEAAERFAAVEAEAAVEAVAALEAVGSEATQAVHGVSPLMVVPVLKDKLEKAKPLELRRLLNRELSWLQFNGRVLAEALDERTPLLERVRFLSIFNSNLDEFFMIRVSGLRTQMAGAAAERSADGLTPSEQL